METNKNETPADDEDRWFFISLMVGAVIFFIILLSIPIRMIVNWDEAMAYRAASFECEKAGGKYSWVDSSREGKACMKEYTSCGPDENKPGFTACEQKFKRID